MEPHSDLPYRASPPKKLLFFCESLPSDGWASGGSPIVDTRALYKALDPAVREKFERLGIQYMYHNADQNHDDRLVPWQSSFHSDDRAVVDEHAAAVRASRDVRQELREPEGARARGQHRDLAAESPVAVRRSGCFS